MDIRRKYIRRGIRTAARTCGDETFVIIITQGNSRIKCYKMFTLGKDGTFLWGLLEENRQAIEVVSAIMKLNKICSVRLERKLVTYIEKLAKEHILDIVEKPLEEYY